jgi:ribosomal protein S18 acetylase RimI-like enzyme
MPGDDANWFIEHVATAPRYRGRGLALALLAHALAEGAAAGHQRATITFYIGNDAAERCYAKAGFVAAEERRHPEFEALTGAPGFRRFERAI